ncbi:unnamed protein product [Paramecium octaurelia]|uniref:Uncharacterized protein n=1 Tax=Paramecium octaurelia TaxID=43137 RepID=A0A8S1WVM1_PAROT|nr:unnamed protein product [Paramecium octaurelia]
MFQIIYFSLYLYHLYATKKETTQQYLHFYQYPKIICEFLDELFKIRVLNEKKKENRNQIHLSLFLIFSGSINVRSMEFFIKLLSNLILCSDLFVIKSGTLNQLNQISCASSQLESIFHNQLYHYGSIKSEYIFVYYFERNKINFTQTLGNLKSKIYNISFLTVEKLI